MTCALTPYSLAFPEVHTEFFQGLDTASNFVFGLDLIFNFFTAYYDAEYTIVDEVKVRHSFD